MTCLTSENVILVILIGLGTDLYQTFQAIVVHKCMNKIFVVLQNTRTNDNKINEIYLPIARIITNQFIN